MMNEATLQNCIEHQNQLTSKKKDSKSESTCATRHYYTIMVLSREKEKK